MPIDLMSKVLKEAMNNTSRIDALSDAVAALTAELSLDRVLRRIAEIAARLVNARYAALGVPDGEGGLAQFLTYGIPEQHIALMDHLPIGRGLLGALLTDTNPIRLTKMSDDPRAVGFPAHHPMMGSFLGVPVISKGIHLGNLYLCDRLDGQPFTDDDEQIITLLAGHAAIAIENARLSESLRRLAIIEERDRIAMELHDGIIQQIYAVGIKLDIARITGNASPELSAQLLGATADLNRVIEDLRRYIRDLHMNVSYTVSLQEQFRELTENFRSVSPARLVSDIAPTFRSLTEAIVHATVQIGRELLSNIARHADATEVYLTLEEDSRGVILEISDNGCGFDPSTVQRGNGLDNMASRATSMGGAFEITSEIGRGATFRLILPPKQ
jgi:signal transduction histidine kinase